MGRLSEKQWFVVVLAVAVLVSGGFGFLSVLENRKIEEKKVAIGRVQEEIERVRAKERRIVALESDLVLLRAKNLDNEKALPAHRFDDALLKGIQSQATASGVRITGVDPGREGGSGRARPPSADPWESTALTLNVEGTFFPLLAFVNGLEHYPRLLAVKQGSFRVVSPRGREEPGKAVTAAKVEGEEAVRRNTVGPPMEMQIVLEAYVAKSAPDSPRPPPLGDVFRVNEDFRIPEEDLVQVENRRNPFAVWLEPRISEPPQGGKESLDADDHGEIEAILARWREGLDGLTLLHARRDDPENVYFAWKALVREIAETRLPPPFTLEREELLRSLRAESFEPRILEAYDVFLEGFARKIRIRLESAFHAGLRDEVCADFAELFEKILAGDRLSPRVREELGACMDRFLAVLSGEVEGEGDYRFVLETIAGIEKRIPEDWKRKPFVAAFMEKMEAFEAKARALEEFHGMGIRVSGIVWLPDDAAATVGRVAIVNDHAVLEGETVDLQAVHAQRALGGKEPQRPLVTLESVGRDRFVWFRYKGLRIQYAIGARKRDAPR